MDEAQAREITELVERGTRYRETHQLEFYEPYAWQAGFHNARDPEGKLARQVLLLAANKVGKSFTGARHCAIAATGDYPGWWEGPVWRRPVKVCVGGNSNVNTRDIVQAELLGEPGLEEEQGTAAIPADAIMNTERLPGIPNALSRVTVRHRPTRRNSSIKFKSYEMGARAWMGEAFDLVWLDEEPPPDIYSQALRSVIKTGGQVILTFTPESGITEVVGQFMNNLAPGQALVTATWNEAPHLDDATKRQLLAAFPPHERDMRSRGVPMLGSGAVFTVPEEEVAVEPFTIPEHWPRIGGIDFGFDHPFAAAWVAYDRDADVAYIYHVAKIQRATVAIHCESLRARGGWIPFAWPHDGHTHDRGSGEALAQQYRNAGVLMLPEHFENPEGGNSVEAGLSALRERLETGRLKVFSHLGDWFSEYRTYHYKDGKLVKLNDDLMSATRYAVQSLRFARTEGRRSRMPALAEGTGSDWSPFDILQRD